MVLAFFFLGGLLTTRASFSLSQEATWSLGVRSCRLLGYNFLWVCSGFIYFGFFCPCVSPLQESSSPTVQGCRCFLVLVCVSWVM
ncbi:hypothetical protein RHMOL_Rhmol06G0115200 [Rhododendron molle]|uniref:Uncharacterized protein n=1 Tax=Rhododendron molle TaxID=49168 RepID=A0ACC0NBH4_RHOML|nr:hypothetical protein RHMOL_Rhmol06G0115200 [Rhododendron molle]